VVLLTITVWKSPMAAEIERAAVIRKNSSNLRKTTDKMVVYKREELTAKEKEEVQLLCPLR
jgi:hypothetical protein